LVHFGVNVQTGVLELDDFLGEQLHSERRIAKNDGLVDF
jgi:hypothetical protein